MKSDVIQQNQAGGGGRKRWTVEQSSLTLSMYVAGERVEKIAAVVGKTVPAVKTHVYLAGVKRTRRVPVSQELRAARRVKEKLCAQRKITDMSSGGPPCPKCGAASKKAGHDKVGNQAWGCRRCAHYFRENPTRKEWTEGQIAQLRTMYPAGARLEEISSAIGKSVAAIKVQACRLKLDRKRPPMKEEHRRHQSEVQKGRKPYEMTDATRARMREGQLVAWQDPDRRKRGLEHLAEVSAIGREHAAELRRGQTTWNKGMKPWEWMKMSEGDFYIMLAESQKRRPTTPEKKAMEIIEELGLPWRYVGDGQVWIAGKNPDFIHKDEKVVLEVFGRYWHAPEELPERTKLFASVGWKMLVLWEDEVDVSRMVALTA
jgi:very-short-patch-repair endonuclease